MPPGIAVTRPTPADSSARFYTAGEVQPFARFESCRGSVRQVEKMLRGDHRLILIPARPAERVRDRGVQGNHRVAVGRQKHVVRCGRKFDRLGETLAVREKRNADMIALNVEPNRACPVLKTA